MNGGNSIITAHVWDTYDQPGPFYNLKNLKYGDVIQFRTYSFTAAWGCFVLLSVAPEK